MVWFLKSILILYSVIAVYQCQIKEEVNSSALSSELEYGVGSNSFLDLYQNWISPVKGGNLCPMYPSCSQYAKIEFSHNTFINAYINTFERILRCGSSLYLYPRIKDKNSLRWFDPPPSLKLTNQYCQTIIKNTPQNRDSLGNKNFSDYLFGTGKYQLAKLEYSRLLFNDKNNLNILSKLGMCFYFSNDKNGLEQFKSENIETINSSNNIKHQMDYLSSLLSYQEKDYSNAIKLLEWNSISQNDHYFRKYKILLGSSFLRMYKWEEAINSYESINNSGNYNQLIDDIKNVKNLPLKSPALAGFLSAIIPGSGYIYSDRIGTGLLSLAINSLLIWSISDAIKSKNYGISLTLGFFGAGWYLGNIKGSMKAADHYNKFNLNEQIDKILKNEDFKP